MSDKGDKEWRDAVLRASKDFDHFMRGVKSGLIYLHPRGWVKFENYIEYIKEIGKRRFGKDD